MKQPFSIIVAVDRDFGIGKNGGLPWNLPGDMRHFKEITTLSQGGERSNAVIMGRKTWESIPAKFRPLPDRLNVVLTRDANLSLPSRVLKASGLDEALRLLEDTKKIGKIFVIGGAEIFYMAIQHPQCQELFLTHIQQTFDCDCFFPAIPSSFKEILRTKPTKEGDVAYHFVTYFCDI